MFDSGNQIVLYVAIALFVLGVVCLILSIIILAKQAMSGICRQLPIPPRNLRIKGLRTACPVWSGTPRC